MDQSRSTAVTWPSHAGTRGPSSRSSNHERTRTHEKAGTRQAFRPSPSATGSKVELRAELHEPPVEGRRRPLPRCPVCAVVVVGPERVAAVHRMVDVEVQLQLAAAAADDLAHPDVELVDAVVEVLRQRL